MGTVHDIFKPNIRAEAEAVAEYSTHQELDELHAKLVKKMEDAAWVDPKSVEVEFYYEQIQIIECAISILMSK